MRLLLDTHAFLWWESNDGRLGAMCREVISDADNDVFVSVASLWEIAIKAKLGKLSADIPMLIQGIETNEFTLLPVTPQHVLGTLSLPLHHGDPFDRMLIAQGRLEELIIVSDDARFPAYPIEVRPCRD